MSFGKGDVILLGKNRSAVVENVLTDTVKNIYTGSPDLVIKNAAVIDSTGVFMADIAVKNGRISHVGKVPYGDCMSVDANGLILTAGRICFEERFDSCSAASKLFSGVTTVVYHSEYADSMLHDHFSSAMGLPLNFYFTDRYPDSQFHISISESSPNFNILTELSELTLAPACRCGLDDHVGSVSTGRLADLCLFKPEDYPDRPYKIIKSGRVIYDRSVTDRGDIVYTMCCDTSAMPARNCAVFFTRAGSADSTVSKLIMPERMVVALRTGAEF